MIDRLSGVLNKHRGQRFNPYASGYKHNILVKQGCQPTCNFFLAGLLPVMSFSRFFLKTHQFHLSSFRAHLAALKISLYLFSFKRFEYGVFQKIGLPNPVFTVENSADNNPIHKTHSKSMHTTRMVSNPLLQNSRWVLRPAELHKVKPVQF